MVVSLCKGTHLRSSSSHGANPVAVVHRDMAVGTLFLVGSCVSYVLWFVVQARVVQAAIAAAVAIALSGAGQGLASEAWKLRWDMQLATVVYSGVFNTGVTFVLVPWAVARRGPVYPSMFNSLSLVATTVVDAVVLSTSTMSTSAGCSGRRSSCWGSTPSSGAKARSSQQPRPRSWRSSRVETTTMALPSVGLAEQENN
jgi:drug/metabolite transporter (DMT)-like permease